MKTYSVLNGQSLFDVAVLVYGNVSGVNYLVADNGLNGATDRILEGDTLLVRDDRLDARTQIFLQDYPVVATISNKEMTEGVGYWGVDEYEVAETIANYLILVPGLSIYELGAFVNETGKFYTFKINKSGVFDVAFIDFASEVAQVDLNVNIIANVTVTVGPIIQSSYRLLIGGLMTQSF